MNDRIKLAEAMGWKTVRQTKEWHGPTWEGVKDGEHTWRLPDPFTSADDDYVVLEWMRKFEFTQKYRDFIFELRLLQNKRADLHPMLYENYQIGDYARAALEVIDR